MIPCVLALASEGTRRYSPPEITGIRKRRVRGGIPIYMYYNFVRRHQTLTERHSRIHCTPPMEAGVVDRVWKLEEVVGLLEIREGMG